MRPRMDIISIGHLLSKPQGSTENYYDCSMNADFSDAPEISSKNLIHFDLEVIKLSHEFTLHLKNLSYEVSVVCSRCLMTFPLAIKIESASRQYIYDLPKEDIAPDEDVFYIDRSSHTIGIKPFIREELLLHFPTFPVCSEGCKGLCALCGVNRNVTTCQCPQKLTNNPFTQLLDKK